MKAATHQRLLFVAFLAGALGLLGYFVRGDYYHQQSDQFYYLELADSLARVGQMLVTTTPFEAQTVPFTGTAGAALLMYPFTGFSYTVIATVLCLLYFLLRLTTIYPLYRVLIHFGYEEKLVERILTVFYATYAVTLFTLWPINEGPAFVLTSWFLYFFLVRPKTWAFLPLAALAPVFRPNIFILEIAALILSGATKSRALALRTLTAVAASLAGAGVYKVLFPYKQAQLAGAWSGDTIPIVIRDLFAAVAHVFIPEGAFMRLFDMSRVPAVIVGVLAVIAISIAAVSTLRQRKNPKREGTIFAVSVALVSVLFLCLAFVVLGRLFWIAYLWLLVLLFAHAARVSRKASKALFVGFMGVNALLYVAAPFIKSSDPQYDVLEYVKTLSAHAGEAEVLHLEPHLVIHPRRLYAYFRRPVRHVSQLVARGHVIILTDKPALWREKLAACHVQKFPAGWLWLVRAECRR